MSSSADTRVVAATMIRNAAAFSALSAITNWNTTVQDTHGMVNLTNGSFTIKVPGSYQLDYYSNYSTALAIVTGPRINGSSLSIWTSDSTTFYKSLSLTLPNLKSGDVVDFGAGSGTAGTGFFRASLSLLQGPSQIQASEVIAAIYRNCSTTVAGSGVLTTLNFADKVQDTHNAVTTGASWTFTAPAPGFYVIQGYAQATADSFTIGGNFVFDLTVNGVDQVIRLGRYDFHRTGTISPCATLSGTVYLNAGNTLQIKAAHSESGARTMVSGAMFNQINIFRLGGV